MNQSPILFLDIDGVMNTTSSALHHKGGHRFTLNAVLSLLRIVDKSDCDIVITSTRRREGIPAMKELFRRNQLHCVADRITAITPLFVDSDTDDYREDEIERWIDDHAFQHNFAILDDKQLFGPMRHHLVLTDHDAGLTIQHTARVIALLKGISQSRIIQ